MVAHQLIEAPSRLFDANIFHPTPFTLALSDAMLLVSLLGAPAIWLGVPPPVVHNWLLAAAFVTSAGFMFLLVRDLTRASAAAWVAAVIFAFAPYRMAHLGHLELQWMMWMPLSLWLLHRFVAAPTAARAIGFGAAIAGQFLCSVYYGAFLSIYLGVASIAMVALGTPPPRRVIRGALLALIPLVAAAALYAPPYAYTRALVGARDAFEIKEYSATPADFLRVPPDNRWRGNDIDPGPAPDERSLYPGTVAIVAAAAAFVPPVAPLSWIHLGLVVFTFDAALGVNGVTIPALHRVAPPLTSLRAPARFGALMLLSIAVLAGLGIAKAASRWPDQAIAIAGVLTVGCLVEYWMTPVRTRTNQEPPSAAHQWLALQPRGSVVLELPVPTGDSLWLYETTYLIRSTHHWQPLINGYSGFAPPEYQRTLEQLRGFPDEASLDRLRQLNTRFILLNQQFYTAPEFTELIASVSGSAGLLPPRSFGPEGRRVVVVELARR